MVPTCGSDGARQSRVQQPQQLGAPTVDATECGCSGRLSRSIRTDDPPFCLDRDILATGAGYVPATSEVVVVSADRALALPSTRPRRALRNNVLKMLHLRRFCVTPACNIPHLSCDFTCKTPRHTGYPLPVRRYVVPRTSQQIAQVFKR